MPGEEGRIRAPTPEEIERYASARLPLDGDAGVRAWRSIQALLSYNPEQIKQQLPRLFLHDRVGFEIALLDASQAPFRRNGKGFSLPYANALQAGTSNVLIVTNIAQDATLVMLDYLLYNGNSPLRVFSQRLTGQASDYTVPAIEVEEPIVGALFSTNPGPDRPVVKEIQTKSSTFNGAAPGGTQLASIPAVAGGPFPLGAGGIPVWPGEYIFLFQSVQAVAIELTLVGRVWRFGSSFPDSLRPTNN